MSDFSATISISTGPTESTEPPALSEAGFLAQVEHLLERFEQNQERLRSVTSELQSVRQERDALQGRIKLADERLEALRTRLLA